MLPLGSVCPAELACPQLCQAAGCIGDWWRFECFVCSHSKMLPLEHAVRILWELCSTVSHSLAVCVFAMVSQLAGFACCMAGVLRLNAGHVTFFKCFHLQVALV
mmetsp:Transcript_116680/g.375545  ORF Transcript_116680/g.375545 Transcript_116680/m.375545 type:complete len:104 (+) Transcript_116680:344-655(+)